MLKFLRSVLIVLLSLPSMIAPGIQSRLFGGERAFFEKWSPESVYTQDYAQTLDKDPNRDFVILNVTDLQLYTGEIHNEVGASVSETVDRLVEQVKPDLITVTGDNAWGKYEYIQTAKMLDSYGIPWAPVMGNHDGEHTFSEFWCAMVMANCRNCLFRFGPEDMGYGNYILNIRENGDVIHSLFMMDTHSNRPFEDPSKEGLDYDHLWENQMQWYAWGVKGIAEKAGHPVQSTVMFHIPLVEYKDAWESVSDGNNAILPEYADTAFGVKYEGICSSTWNNGFFDLCKSLGSTKDMICGHDHVNSFSVPYEGIRLTYGLKTGKGCYYDETLNGGTVLRIHSDGQTEVEHVYVDLSTLTGKRMPIYY